MAKLKRGDTREDGLVYYRILNGKEAWVTTERLTELRKLHQIWKKKHNQKKHPKPPKTSKAKTKKEYRDKWNTANPMKKKQQAHKYWHTKGKFIRKDKSTPEKKLIANVRTRVRLALKHKRWTRSLRTQEYVGCTWAHLKSHLENQFQKGMTWDNYGLWHIDHIFPLSKATNPLQLRLLLHYTNTQPLWAKENLSKGSNV